jgi:anti-sigma-K factor RskA
VVFAAYVAVSVTHLVAMEVFHVFGMKISARGFSTGMVWSVIAMLRVVVVVYVTVEVIRAVKPGTRPDEETAAEPLRAVVAVGSAVVGRGFVVAIRAHRSRADVDADLGLRLGAAIAIPRVVTAVAARNLKACMFHLSLFREN